ncbi:MAG: amidohydrolase family protein [Woeseiaceae bacterium]|nr:amidohydrolase family protein [Woeseiaceae bacterium]
MKYFVEKAIRRLSATLLCIGLAYPAGAQADDFDILIKGGVVVDGSGAHRFDADVAIRGDRIVFVGKVPPDATADTIINATGRIVAPGFIDPHSHAAPGIETAELAAAEPILYQGITTVMINPDGGGPADLKPQIDNIKRNEPGVNVVPLIGHNGVRRAVMQIADRSPTDAEQAAMERLVREAMETGAFGLSTGPFYVPGKYSTTEEIIGLASVTADFPNSFHISHIRDESNYDVGVIGAIEEVIRITRETRLPGVVTHMKMLGPHVWGKSKEAIRVIDEARAEGLEIWADQYPYSASGSGLQPALVPGWAQEGGEEEMIARLENPQQLKEIRPEMAENLERRAGPNAIMIRDFPPTPEYVGKRLDDIAGLREEEPLDTAIEMLKNGGAPIISFNMDERDLEAIMRQPWTMTSSDGSLITPGERLNHPRAYGAFPRKIKRYVLDSGILTLEQAIHSSSGLTAKVFSIEDRGLIRAGYFADVLVINLATLKDHATYQKPEILSEGMDYVIVNGRTAIGAGKLAPDRSGRVLLRD